jgi:hypothetical protein
MAGATPYPYGDARHLRVHGALLVWQGEVGPARERLEAALATFRWLGTHKDVERAEDLLATLG